MKTPASSLRDKRKHLENEMVLAAGLLDKASIIAEPYEAAFWQAHRQLEELCRQRDGEPWGKATRRVAYDARMNAGHRWHPFRQAKREVTHWVNSLRSELLAVNKAIGD